MRTRRDCMAAIAAAALLTAIATAPPASAQETPVVRFRGTIEQVEGRTVTISTLSGKTASVDIPDKAPVVAAVAGDMADIKDGSFIGSAARTLPDGRLEALEVHVFADSMRGAGVGHRAWDLGPETTMTNGTVGKVVVSQGRTITVTYPNGEQTIVVPPDVPIVRTEPGTWADVKPGVAAVVAATEAQDGTLSAQFLVVGRNGVHPPM